MIKWNSYEKRTLFTILSWSIPEGKLVTPVFQFKAVCKRKAQEQIFVQKALALSVMFNSNNNVFDRKKYFQGITTSNKIVSTRIPFDVLKDLSTDCFWFSWRRLEILVQVLKFECSKED